ncbi:chorion peroxidase-like isoform X1 [Cylas formicarius]|uniref:chorion peroxidase-like isoform X1 n=1 Tax=Cylas formicarius TaxID=197179 RepID=UPI002958BE50|nr:chorion peroxidase-like isoform X1 [Cylas formicarius]XP_060522115.1 chorion peroxidase-like isoform X1 [Cylas formicarius]XP_060522117.1 chorion peroxidase-like isoform X1 [Cylas formicarius]
MNKFSGPLVWALSILSIINLTIAQGKSSLISDDLLKDAISKAKETHLERMKMQYRVWAAGGGLDPKSHQATAAAFGKANKHAIRWANTSLLYELASKEILNALGHTKRPEILSELKNIDVSDLLPATKYATDTNCSDSGPCDATSPYRTLTGYCNNLAQPDLGTSLSNFRRLLSSAYDDGISAPRITAASGNPLPNPRSISTTVHPDVSHLSNNYTMLIMQFAQFLDHDITLTPLNQGFQESIPSCRPCDSKQTVHPECNPFQIPPDDDFFPQFNSTTGEQACFPSMRTLQGQSTLGSREQVNQNTPYLDGSVIYGENNCVLQMVKGENGRLNASDLGDGSKDYLPRTTTNVECKSASGLCFYGGDGRASEQAGLSMMHTIFLREHNRINDALQTLNPSWSADKRFNETRRIVVAILQHITYNEFLPRILGDGQLDDYGLRLLDDGFYVNYDPNCSPDTYTEFAAAAYRIGHSLLRARVPMLDNNFTNVDPPLLLRDSFFQTDRLFAPNIIDDIARGISSTPMEDLDRFVTNEVTNHLFENTRVNFTGVDLVALNIQRARDHGIPPYNDYRAYCLNSRADTFDDLSDTTAADAIEQLQQAYESVDDIDLFPGGLTENQLPGGLVGPTFGCIIGLQFARLKQCDRFWYETQDRTVGFSEQQLAEIRKITFSKLICDNIDGNNNIHAIAFNIPSDSSNPRVPCDSLPAPDLTAWQE